MNHRLPLLSLLIIGFACSIAYSQSQTLSFSLFSGDGPGNFNFADNGSVQAITLDAGGTTTSGSVATLYQGGAGDTVFFFDHTTTGKTYVANNADSPAGGLFDENNTDVDGIAAPGDVLDVAVDEFNNFVFFTSRGSRPDGTASGTDTVYRAPLDPVTKAISGPAIPFLSTDLDDVTSLHLTSASRLLVADRLEIFAVDPTNAANITPISFPPTGEQIRGLEEDVANGFIYFSSDETDDISRVPSSGGSATVILDGTGTAAGEFGPSYQDILLDEVNDRLILADFSTDGNFDTDGAILSYPLDRATGALTSTTPSVLLDQAGLQDPDGQNAYFTGLQFVPFEVDFPLVGDYNGNGVVDAADYTIWRDNEGLAGGATIAQGDGNGDGNVDSLDYDLWVANFGESNLSTSSAVPEPSSAAILLLLATAHAMKTRVS